MKEAQENPKQVLNWRLMAALLFVVGVGLWGRSALTANLPNNWMPDWSDDFVFVSQAQEINNGNWLGAYDFRQLRNPPGLSLTLAASLSLGISERSLSFVLLALGSLSILVALIRLRIPSPLAVFAFLGVLFNPSLFGSVATRLCPERLFALQYILGIGVVLWLISAKSRRQFWVSGGLLTAIFAWTSITTADASSFWFLMVLGILGQVVFNAKGPTTWRESTRTVLPLLILIALGGWSAKKWIETRNLDHFGVAILSETNEPKYLAALGAIRRVARTEAHDFGALTRRQRQSLYRHVPLMQKLKPVLESPIYSGPSPEEIEDLESTGRPAALFRLALREAAAQAGMCDSAVSSSEFFGDLANEINEACDQGILTGTKERFENDSPLWNFVGLGQTIHRLWYRLHELWRFEYEDMQPADALAGVAANQEEVATYERVLLSKAGRMANRPYVDADRRRQIRRLFQWLYPALFFAAIVALITQVTLIKERGLDRFLYLESMFFICCVIHVFAISWQEVFWQADQGRGLFPGYFMLVLWVSISLGAYGRFGTKKASAEQVENRALAGNVVMGLLLLLAMPVIEARAQGTESPVLDHRGGAFDAFYIFAEGAELESKTEGIKIRFPRIDDAALLRWKRMEFGDARDLIIEAELAQDALGSSFEISWTGSRFDQLGGQTRQLFAKQLGLNRWQIPLSEGRIKTISITTRDSARLSMLLKQITLESGDSPYIKSEFPLPEIEAQLAKDGQLRFSIKNGERESRYDFYLSGSTDETPRIFPNRTGGMWLNDAQGIKDQMGQTLRIRVTTNALGDGQAVESLHLSPNFEGDLFLQGLGTKHFTEVKKVEQD